MANENQTLTFKLVIDGKEATATVQIAKKDIEDLNASISKIQERPILKQFAKDLLLVDASAQEATSGIMDFIKYNEMTESEIQSIIATLREEQKVLATSGPQWRTHGQAIENLTNAYQRTIVQQRSFTGTSNAARMAVGQFGFALGDASMIAVDFRMFLMSIGNNIPFIVQGLAEVSKEAKNANMSFGAFLKNNLDASMKMVLGANALMFALTVLPVLFNKINEASGDAAGDGMKKFNDELKTMTSGQILNSLEAVRKKLKQIDDERKDYSNLISSSGSYPVVQRTVRDPKDRGLEDKESSLSEEEKKILDARTKRKAALELEINDYDKLIDQVEKDALAEVKITMLKDQQAVKQKELDELLKTSEDRADDRKQAAEEHQKTIDDQIKKQDEYIKSISEQYELQTELNKITKQNNTENIKDTRSLIDAQLKNNITLAQRVELLKLLDRLDNGWKEDRWKAAPDKPDSSKEFDEAQKRLKKLESDDLIDQKTNVYEREAEIDRQKKAEELDFYNRAYKDKLISETEFLRAKDIIEEQYDRKSRQRDKEAFLQKINTVAQLSSIITSAYNEIYSTIESNVKEEIGTWKDKEEKKLDTERDAALKHARTQAQREKINDQFDKKQEQLDEEADKKAREKMVVWFRLKQAGDIASATMSTYKAADEQLGMPPVGPWNIALAGVMIAAGLANVAVIASQKMPGYARGGAIVGEDGPEIIAPFQDYASGQSKLIAMTMMTLKDEIRASSSLGSSSSNDYREIKESLNKLNKHLDEGINARAYLSDREAAKINSRGAALNRKSKI